MSTTHKQFRADLIDADTVRAESVRVVDTEARTRIHMHVPPNGIPVLALKDKQEVDRLRLTLDSNERGLISLLGADGGQRVSLGITSDGQPEICLCDATGILRVVLHIDAGQPALRMYHSDRTERLAIRLGVDGRPCIAMNNADGNLQAELTVRADGGEGLVCQKRDGREYEIVVAPPE